MLVAKNAVVLAGPAETVDVFDMDVGFESVRKIGSSRSDLLFAVAESTPQAHRKSELIVATIERQHFTALAGLGSKPNQTPEIFKYLSLDVSGNK
jgi:hypothetical protein